MIFPCPKCDAKTQLDLPHISEEGTSAKCPECKTRFWITKESFARRAIKKEGKSLCYYCNNELSTFLDCPTCGVMYPDLCVVQLSKPVKRTKRKSSSSISFSLRPARRTKTHSIAAAEQLSTQRVSKSLLVNVVLLSIVALLVVAAGLFYFNMQLENKYSVGFVRTLYGIKLGADFNIKQCRNISESAKQAGTVQVSGFGINDKDKAKLNLAKSDIDTLMHSLPKAPGKFVKISENLNRLYDVYSRSYTLASAPSGSVTAFADSTNKLENEFRQTAQEVKSSMPSGMADDFKKALPKYKELQDF